MSYAYSSSECSQHPVLLPESFTARRLARCGLPLRRPMALSRKLHPAILTFRRLGKLHRQEFTSIFYHNIAICKAYFASKIKKNIVFHGLFSVFLTIEAHFIDIFYKCEQLLKYHTHVNIFSAAPPDIRLPPWHDIRVKAKVRKISVSAKKP